MFIEKWADISESCNSELVNIEHERGFQESQPDQLSRIKQARK